LVLGYVMHPSEFIVNILKCSLESIFAMPIRAHAGKWFLPWRPKGRESHTEVLDKLSSLGGKQWARRAPFDDVDRRKWLAQVETQRENEEVFGKVYGLRFGAYLLVDAKKSEGWRKPASFALLEPDGGVEDLPDNDELLVYAQPDFDWKVQEPEWLVGAGR
jgi:hypothetical protein